MPLDNEVNIRLRLDYSGLTAPPPTGTAGAGGGIGVAGAALAGGSVQTSVIGTRKAARNARMEMQAWKAANIQQGMDDFERLERRFTRRMLRMGVRTTAGMMMGELSDTLGIEGNPLVRMGISAAQGLAFGGPHGAVLGVALSSISMLISQMRNYQSDMEAIKRDRAEIKNQLKQIQEERRKELLNLQEKTYDAIHDERVAFMEEAREEIYQLGQYMN